MKPVRVLINQVANLLATDISTLGGAQASKVGLIIAPFAPGVDLVLSNLTIAAAAGLTPLAGVSGPQLESIDPMTGENIVEIKAPAGGFRWETPGGFVGPVSVFGYALTDNAGAVLLATQAVNPAITLTDANQSLTAPALTFRIDGTKMF